MPKSGSCNRSVAITRTVMRMRFLGLLTVTVSSNPFPAKVLVPITTGLDPDAFTLVFRIPRVIPDLLGTNFLNLAISLPLPHLSFFHVSSNFYNFYPS